MASLRAGEGRHCHVSRLAEVDTLRAQRGDRGRIGAEQPEDEMRGRDLCVACLLGLVHGRDDRVVGGLGELVESGPRGGGRLADEPLLHSLLGDAHPAADVGPGRPGVTGPVDEMTDEVVGDLSHAVGHRHGFGQLVQGVSVALGDRRDQVVEPDRRSSLGHIVNLRLSIHGSSSKG